MTDPALTPESETPALTPQQRDDQLRTAAASYARHAAQLGVSPEEMIRALRHATAT